MITLTSSTNPEIIRKLFSDLAESIIVLMEQQGYDSVQYCQRNDNVIVHDRHQMPVDQKVMGTCVVIHAGTTDGWLLRELEKEHFLGCQPHV